MLSKESMLKNFYAILSELNSGTVDLSSNLGIRLSAKLSVYADILGDDIPEEYWDAVEKYA